MEADAKAGEGSPRRAEPASPRSFVATLSARLVAYDPLEAPPWEQAGLAALSALAYGVAVVTPLARGGLLAPRAGPGWAVFCVWLMASATGRALGWLGLPPLAGQLLGGALARNSCAFRDAALTHQWRATIRALGLGTIMTRSGLELDVDAIRRAGRVAAQLTVLPGVSEALAVGVVARWVFDLPFVLALSLGFILAAVSPAVVVVGMFDLQQRGYGRAKGIPSLVVAAASMDDVVAMLGFSVCIGLAQGGGNIWQKALTGPVAVVAGALYGCAGGAVLGATKLWDRDWKLTVATIVIGLLPMFVAEALHAHGGGAIGALLVGIVGSLSWRRGFPARLATGANASKAHHVEAHIGLLWTWLAQPLLFGAIGAELNFHRMAPAVAGRALLVVGVGLLVRIPAAYLAVRSDARLNFRERAFVALAWLPKATVQAALASVPAEVVNDPGRGEAILTTAILAILVTAPLGSLFIQRFGPRWLEREGAGGEKAAPPAEAPPPPEPPSLPARSLGDLVGEARAEIGRLDGADTARLAAIVDAIGERSAGEPRIPKQVDNPGNFFKLQKSELAAARRRKRWAEAYLGV